ncbi:MAG: hypothetical protein WC152_07625, partial [Candidatus Izemoplasmatales bacterium]
MNLDKLKEQIKEFLITTSYDLYDVEYVANKKDPVLRIYIDSLEGVSMDDVVEATRLLDPFIDKLDPIDHEYTL